MSFPFTYGFRVLVVDSVLIPHPCPPVFSQLWSHFINNLRAAVHLFCGGKVKEGSRCGSLPLQNYRYFPLSPKLFTRMNTLGFFSHLVRVWSDSSARRFTDFKSLQPLGVSYCLTCLPQISLTLQILKIDSFYMCSVMFAPGEHVLSSPFFLQSSTFLRFFFFFELLATVPLQLSSTFVNL